MELVFSLRVLQNVIDMKESVVNKVRMFPSIKYFKTSDWSKWDTCSSWNFLVVAPTWKRQLKKREVGKYRLKLVSFQNCKQVIKNFPISASFELSNFSFFTTALSNYKYPIEMFTVDIEKRFGKKFNMILFCKSLLDLTQ